MTVWKFTLALTPGVVQQIEMSADAQMLHVAFQDRQLCMWAFVDPTADAEDRWFVVVGTGHPAPATGQHVGSVLSTGGALVWHVFEVWI